LSALFALLTPVLAVALWDKVKGSRAKQVLGRIGLLGLGEVAALTFAFVALNDYAGFVDSWSQAFHFVTNAFEHQGAASTAGKNKARPAPGASGDPNVYAEQDFLLGSQQAPAPDGHIWRIYGSTPPDKWAETGVTVLDEFGSGGLDEGTYVWLPPQYFGPGARRDLPITEVFTPYAGPTDYLISKLHVPDVMLAGVKSGEIAPMVVVMLRPDAAGLWNTACSDVPNNGPQTLTYYTKDLPTAVRHRFGLNTAPGLALGYAGGGYCAAKLSMFDPGDFPAAVAMSGTLHPPGDPTTRNLFADPNVRNQNDIEWRLQNLPLPSSALLLTTSSDDKRPANGYQITQQWASLIHPPMTVEQLVFATGAHGYDVYARQMAYCLSWLSGHVPGSAVHRAPVPAGATTPGGH
jgi:hypothetical protein